MGTKMKYITLNVHGQVDKIIDTDKIDYTLTGDEISITQEQWDKFYSTDNPYLELKYQNGDFVRLTQEEKDALSWKEERMKAYGSIESQIEFIVENGLDAWQQKVQQIKDSYPKLIPPGKDRDDEVV